MGDAGEALIDAESRIQERMDEMARERSERNERVVVDPELERALASLKLARVDMERQQASTTHEGRRSVIAQAIAEIDRRIADLNAPKTAPSKAAAATAPAAGRASKKKA
jgi:hypothetical protein